MNQSFGYQNNDFTYTDTSAQKNEPQSKFETASMVLGIISLAIVFCCTCALPVMPITSVLAIVFSNMAKKDMNGVRSGKSTAGLVLGIIGLILFVLLLIGFGFMVWLQFRSLSSDPAFYRQFLQNLEVYLDINGYNFDFNNIYDALEEIAQSKI